MFRCLVTGGLGYAGTWISSRLAAAGHEVFVLSRGIEKPDIGQPYTLISADVEHAEPEHLAALLPQGLDGVVHAASVNESFVPDYPRKALLVNALGTRNLLEALRLGQNGRLPLLLYCSTFHVYGQGVGSITEQTPAAPRNDYALTHFFAEEYCRMALRLHGQSCIILRLSNGYGAPLTDAGTKWHLLINDLCKSAADNGELRLHSDPATPRDFVWLGDVAAVMEKLLGRADLSGKLFNISSGRAVSIGEIAALVARTASRALGRDIPVIFEHQGGSSGDAGTTELHVSNEALRSALGFRFQDRMEEEVFAILRRLRP